MAMANVDPNAAQQNLGIRAGTTPGLPPGSGFNFLSTTRPGTLPAANLPGRVGQDPWTTGGYNLNPKDFSGSMPTAPDITRAKIQAGGGAGAVDRGGELNQARRHYGKG